MFDKIGVLQFASVFQFSSIPSYMQLVTKMIEHDWFPFSWPNLWVLMRGNPSSSVKGFKSYYHCSIVPAKIAKKSDDGDYRSCSQQHDVEGCMMLMMEPDFGEDTL